MHGKRILAAIGGAVLLSGCASFLDQDNYLDFKDDQISTQGTRQVVRKDGFESVRLVPLICEYLPASVASALLDKERKPVSRCVDAQESQENLGQVLAAFNKAYMIEDRWSPGDIGGDNLNVARLRAAKIQAMAVWLDAEMGAVEQALAGTVSAFTAAKGKVGGGPNDSRLSDAAKAAGAANSLAGNARTFLQRIAADAKAATALSDAVDVSAANSSAPVIMAKVMSVLAKMKEEVGKADAAMAEIIKSPEATKPTKELRVAGENVAEAGKAAAAIDNLGGQISGNLSGMSVGARYRNLIQDRVVLAADRRCEVYKSMLASTKTQTSFWTLLSASVVGITGGLVSDTASRYFSAAAGGIAGTGAALDSAVFQGQTIELINFGINAARADWQAKVFDAKRKEPLSSYSLEDAIRHGLQYNGHCSMAAALHYVKDKLAPIPDVNQATNNQLQAAFRQRCAIEAGANKGDKVSAFQRCLDEAKVYSTLLGTPVEPKGEGGKSDN